MTLVDFRMLCLTFRVGAAVACEEFPEVGVGRPASSDMSVSAAHPLFPRTRFAGYYGCDSSVKVGRPADVDQLRELVASYPRVRVRGVVGTSICPPGRNAIDAPTPHCCHAQRCRNHFSLVLCVRISVHGSCLSHVREARGFAFPASGSRGVRSRTGVPTAVPGALLRHATRRSVLPPSPPPPPPSPSTGPPPRPMVWVDPGGRSSSAPAVTTAAST